MIKVTLFEAIILGYAAIGFVYTLAVIYANKQQ